jgi:acetolactate synthase-1/2/3 large subunit
MTGAEFISECLKQEGVSKVFGQCGHTNYALIDALPKVGIDFVSFRHEQLAAHAADAYFRVSHKLAVVLVHLSPGLTNALTGVATAAADLTSMVVISGNTPSYNHAREGHQCIRFHADASQGDIFKPICKRVWRVDDPQLLPDVMPRALNLAQTGRPGAVLIDVPMDVFSHPVRGNLPDTLARRPGHHRTAGADAAIAEAAQLLLEAEKPVLFAGGGVHLSEAWDELKEIAEYVGIPVATTLMGKGAFPENHPLSVGVTGIWGTRLANETTRNADVILAIGTGFGEADCSSWNPKYTFAIPPSRLIQLDVDPQEIGKTYPVDVGIVGDVKASLGKLLERLRDRAPRRNWGESRRFAELETRRQEWLCELVASQHDAGRPIHPARLLFELNQALPEDAIVVTDVGWNKNGAGQQLLTRRPLTFITSGGMATMGYAPAAAIGAKLACPNQPVVALVGDGGLMSACGALATAVELDVPVVWVLFNNYCFSTIRMMGEAFFKNTYGTEFTRPDGTPYNPDFQLLAKAHGIEARLVEEPDQLPHTLKECVNLNAPCLLEVRTRGDLPMPRTGYWDIADFLTDEPSAKGE